MPRDACAPPSGDLLGPGSQRGQSHSHGTSAWGRQEKPVCLLRAWQKSGMVVAGSLGQMVVGARLEDSGPGCVSTACFSHHPLTHSLIRDDPGSPGKQRQALDGCGGVQGEAHGAKVSELP